MAYPDEMHLGCLLGPSLRDCSLRIRLASDAATRSDENGSGTAALVSNHPAMRGVREVDVEKIRAVARVLLSPGPPAIGGCENVITAYRAPRDAQDRSHFKPAHHGRQHADGPVPLAASMTSGDGTGRHA